MFAKHVEAKALEHLEIIDHGLTVRGKMETVWPVALIKGTKEEVEFAIEQRALNSIDNAGGNSAEAGVAVDNVVAQLDSQVVKSRAFGRPEIGRGDLDGKLLVCSAGESGNAVTVFVDDVETNIGTTFAS